MGASTGESEDNAGTIGKSNPNALLLADATINRIGVAKVIAVLNLILAKLLPFQVWHCGAQLLHEGISWIGIHAFIIMAGVVITPISLPVFSDNLLYRLLSHGENI